MWRYNWLIADNLEVGKRQAIGSCKTSVTCNYMLKTQIVVITISKDF
jgi:hypothetical protein